MLRGLDLPELLDGTPTPSPRLTLAVSSPSQSLSSIATYQLQQLEGKSYSKPSSPRPQLYGKKSRSASKSKQRASIEDDLDELRREIAMRRLDQEQRGLELHRILPTEFNDTLPTEGLRADEGVRPITEAEEIRLPHCSDCLLL